MNNPDLLWAPTAERIAEANISRYIAWLEQRVPALAGITPDSLHSAEQGYEALWHWSVTEIEAFWASIWEFGEVRAHRPYDCVLEQRIMPGAKWFPGSLLNYAEHALSYGKQRDAAQQPAIIFDSETRARGELSWAQLDAQVGALAMTLKRLGLRQGERAVAYLPNIPETVTAMLAVTSQGGIWSCAAPDMGATGVLDRFRQIEPSILFAVDGYRYGGKDYDRRQVVAELIEQLPSLRALIFVPYLYPTDQQAEHRAPGAAAGRPETLSFAEATAQPAATEFVPLPFDHPLWIVYSSGTTGMPKPIVHGHGGITLQTLKAGLLHGDAKPGDRYFWFTSTNWIMWNSVVNSLINKATILLFDGNPGYPDVSTLWHFAEREKSTTFGTSPAFIAQCMKAGYSPRDNLDLASLRSVGCTGAPLSAEGYRWVYAQVSPDVRLGCIAGGTDPAACFLTTCPVLPVYAGEMQCRELGVATQAFDPEGKPVMDEVGELVVTEPVPSMPLYFWGDKGNRRYFESYFETYQETRPGVWRHGDWLRLMQRPASVTGIIYGRSDSTINRHGIRMGSSELYRVAEAFPEVLDSLVVDLEYLENESYLALFVVLRGSEPGQAPDGEAAGRASINPDPADGQSTGVSPGLRQQVRQAIRRDLSARHVPDEVFAIPAVPLTLSGKKLEVPVKKILLGHPVDEAVNRDSMLNPESINWFIDFAHGRRAALIKATPFV